MRWPPDDRDLHAWSMRSLVLGGVRRHVRPARRNGEACPVLTSGAVQRLLNRGKGRCDLVPDVCWKRLVGVRRSDRKRPLPCRTSIPNGWGGAMRWRKTMGGRPRRRGECRRRGDCVFKGRRLHGAAAGTTCCGLPGGRPYVEVPTPHILGRVAAPWAAATAARPAAAAQ